MGGNGSRGETFANINRFHIIKEKEGVAAPNKELLKVSIDKDARVSDLYNKDKALKAGKCPAGCEERARNVFTADQTVLKGFVRAVYCSVDSFIV